MSERDEVRELAEEIYKHNLGYEGTSVVEWTASHIDAFLAELEAEWRKEGPERERTLARSLSAQMAETERLREREEELEAQLHRALGEGAGLREFAEWAIRRLNGLADERSGKVYLGDGERAELVMKARAALTSAPLSERAGEVLREAKALGALASDPARQFLVSSDLNELNLRLAALEAELGKGGE